MAELKKVAWNVSKLIGPLQPEVKAIVSNPEGLVANQTTIVKGAGSALLDHILQRYKVLGVEKVQLLATNDKYYIDRGWKAESESNECPTM